MFDWHASHLEDSNRECIFLSFHTSQCVHLIIEQLLISKWTLLNACIHTCRFVWIQCCLNYHNVGIAVHWFDCPLNTPEATPWGLGCHFSYTAIRCGISNFHSATNWLKHKADWFHKWHDQGAKSNRAKAISQKPLHRGKNWKKWNFWLHWQKVISNYEQKDCKGFYNNQKWNLK